MFLAFFCYRSFNAFLLGAGVGYVTSEEVQLDLEGPKFLLTFAESNLILDQKTGFAGVFFFNPFLGAF